MVHLLLAVIYVAFISLGLPDALLGAAWPSMYGAFGVPVSYAGAISMIIAIGTVVSSLESYRLIRRFGTGKITTVSVAITAVALWGFSISPSFGRLCLWAVPYGLGAGSVDAALNHYVALHYASRHMNWLHCMWGIGASLGPYIMGYALTNGQGWNMGYRYVSILQVVLTAALLFSLPLWKRGNGGGWDGGTDKKSPPLQNIVRIPGVKAEMATFFCYCALEQTTGLWSSSYLVLAHGVSPQKAAEFASLFFLGVTIGRGASGFLTMVLRDGQMVRLGQVMVVVGIGLMMFSGSIVAGLIFMGLGCAPIYPCLIHATPVYFGSEHAQAIIGMQMASAYVGTCLMPPLLGLLVDNMGITVFPFYLLLLLLSMVVTHEGLLRKCGQRAR